MGAPLVSVVIPAYNCADVIGDTLGSVARQTYENIETVIVDDGSSDATGKVAESFLGNGKFRYYRQENGGPGAARNTGIRIAKGEFITFLDADDSLTRDSVEKRMSLIAEAKGLELLYSNYFVKRADDSVKARFAEDYPGKRDFFRRECAHGLVFEGSPADIFEIPFDFWTATVLAGRNLLDRTGPFRTDISIGEDRDMWIRLSLNAGKIGYVTSPVATYNRSKNSLTGRNAVRYSMARRDLNRQFLEKYGSTIRGEKVRNVINEKLSWVYYDLGRHYRLNGMPVRAIGNFLKSIYFSPGNELSYKEIASSVLPEGLRNRLKRPQARRTGFLENQPGKKIIMFLPRVPYPLREHGISIRYFPIIEHLSKSHTLDLVIFRPRPGEQESLDVLRKYCRNVSYVQNPRYVPHGLFSKLLTYFTYAVPWSPPLSYVSHGGSEIRRMIKEQSGKDRYDVLLWVGSSNLPHLLSALPLKTVGKILVDFIDSPSLIRKRWKKDSFRFDFLNRYELWKTIRWEGQIIRKMDETLYISEVDSRTVPDALTPGKPRHVVPNGVDFRSYTPEKAAGIGSPSIGFLGNMAYDPNIEAVIWLFREVFLPLKERMPGLSLVLIGRDPVEQVLKLRESPGVTVTGTVENIWPHVNAVDLFLFPLWTGAGLKNKILESMLAGRPVITTSIGNEGINAVSGRDILILHDAAGFQEETMRLLNSPEDRQRMGDHARDFVRHGFSWPPILKAYEDIVTGHVSPGRR